MFTDFFPELLGAVWDKWLEFTEGNADVRSSAVLWDCTAPDRIADVKPGDTALKTRVPHYWMAVQGRYVLRGRVILLPVVTFSVGQVDDGRVRGSMQELHGRRRAVRAREEH